MKTGIIYTGRLGDIVLTLPLAKYLSNNSEVLHYCHAEYADIFKAVSYVKPRIVNEKDRSKCYYKAVKLAKQECDKVYDNQIWPRLYNKYRESKLKWLDFYYSKFRFITDRIPLFDINYDISNHIGDNTCVVSCHAYSDGMGVNWKWIKSAIKEIKLKCEINDFVYLCAKHEKSPLNIKHCSGLPLYLLPSILKKSKLLISRNSSLACMAIGTGTPTFHIKAHNFIKQDTHVAPNLVSIEHKKDFSSVIDRLTKLCR